MSSLRRKISRGSLEIITIPNPGTSTGIETWVAKRRKNPTRFRKNRKGKSIARSLSKYILINRVN